MVGANGAERGHQGLRAGSNGTTGQHYHVGQILRGLGSQHVATESHLRRSDEPGREAARGITVQAFAFDTKGSRESRPLRTAKTDSLGRYTIEPLPAGNYVVAVNGEEYEDREPYPPTFYSRERDAANPAEIRIEDSAEVSGINLVVPDPRTAATLLVEVRSPDGMPRKGATVSLLNLDGVQRYHSTSQTPGDGSMEVPVYLEEQYIVEAYASARPFEYWGGKAQVQITRDGLRLVIHLVQKLVEKQ